ncbi:unnamed protein product [Rotaria sordida]|uniref:Microsomal glutathione S-transferase 1 n=1 Tax=Rotaria sordida TaxID=392033 RepID=A0A815HB63_9BILA|nr:unnamed protein product [Rotaria sordida]CAF1351649.1 unnamed protein product [Rotaria sordida]CAF1370447.1 unnamed protein product [Rotaria sordida]CAF1548902.1 unnamed protein product [Rotaria sordida]CAF4103929.1 unnamed protein product [Rotaria sordida]
MSTVYYTLSNEIFRNFLFYAVASLLKMMIMSLLTARQRFRKNAFANPEDVVTSKIKNLVPTTTDPDVERVRRNHLNDIENIIPFLLIGFCYIPCNPDPNIALWHFRLFFLSRVLHTFAYQIPLAQPSRAITFFIGLITTVSMAIQVLIRVY